MDSIHLQTSPVGWNTMLYCQHQSAHLPVQPSPWKQSSLFDPYKYMEPEHGVDDNTGNVGATVLSTCPLWYQTQDADIEIDQRMTEVDHL